ncbi:hypothetical protein R1flu_009561 [Riccia fluitans]|uniref:arginase n=1 Tax=Riccia fluitans TaxID=41844 RepID=A0ABD1Z501_9MARC
MATAGKVARRAVGDACRRLQQQSRSTSTLEHSSAQSITQGQNRVVEASLTFIRELARLRAEQVRAIGGAKATACLLGVPLGHNSSFLQGPAFAPPRIREAIWCGSTNSATESGMDLNDTRVMTDVGDVPIQEMRNCGVEDERLMKTISDAVKIIMDEHPLRPLVLGGDHSISYPVIRAVTEELGGPVDILHFDAHPDIYHAFEGNIYSHASGFARIMEGGHARRLLQVGIRSINKEGRDQGKKFGVEQYEMRHFSRDRELLENLKLGEGVKGVYVSIDVDCLDPAYAPGVSHIEPGGLSFRDVMNILQNVQGDIVGGDVVEFNPQRDTVDGMTAMVAAKLRLTKIMDVHSGRLEEIIPLQSTHSTSELTPRHWSRNGGRAEVSTHFDEFHCRVLIRTAVESLKLVISNQAREASRPSNAVCNLQKRLIVAVKCGVLSLIRCSS